MTGQNTVRGLKVRPGHGVRSHPRVRPFQSVSAEMGFEFQFFSTVELNAIFKKLYETLYIVQCTMYNVHI